MPEQVAQVVVTVFAGGQCQVNATCPAAQAAAVLKTALDAAAGQAMQEIGQNQTSTKVVVVGQIPPGFGR